MKKISAFILAALLLLTAFSGMASAATAAKPPITVWVGTQKIAFDAPPLTANSTTYVEFKALFKALGFAIAYDAKSKTITGASNGVSLVLNAATGAASVNGQASAKPVKLIVKEGRTLVPLRYVGEATGMKVDWNAAARKITISAKAPTAAEVKELQALLAQMDGFDSDGDLSGFLSLLVPNSPIYEAIKAQGAPKAGDPVVRTTSKLLDIQDFTPYSANVTVSQHAAKVSGGFYLDNDSVIQLGLLRGQDKHWKVRSIGLLQFDYVNTDDVLNHEADVPAEDKAAILAVIDKQAQASADEDLDAYRATIDPQAPNVDQSMETVKQLFDAYDLKYTTEIARIVDFTDNGAVIYVVQTIEKLKGPDYPNSRVFMAVTFRKTEDGQWIDEGTGKLIKVDPLPNV